MANTFTFLVVVHLGGRANSETVTESGDTLIGDVARRVVATMNLSPEGTLVLLHGDRRVPADRTVSWVFFGSPSEALTLHVVWVPWEVNLPQMPETPATQTEITLNLDTGTGEHAPLPPRIEAMLEDIPRSVPPPAAAAPPTELPRGRAMPPSKRRKADWAVEDEDADMLCETGAAPVTRRATVRYYNRMNPEKVFPLLVVLSEHGIREIVQRSVEQKESGPMEIKTESLVEIEPILPGCTCYPAKVAFKVGSGVDTLPFWVVPHVRGKVKGAKVDIRQDGKLLAEVPLGIRVRRQTLAVVSGLFTLAMPLLSSLAKHYQIDFSSQKEQGFAFYFQIWDYLLKQVSPLHLAGALALLTAILYLWARPRKRDEFWDVTPV